MAADLGSSGVFRGGQSGEGRQTIRCILEVQGENA